MANPGYVRSTDGSDADTGATWALANATLTGGMTDAAAGDRVWVSQVHAESTAGAVTITMPGTAASPTQILCGNDAAEPPTSLTTGASVSNSASGAQTIAGNGIIRGMTFNVGFSTANNLFSAAVGGGETQLFDTCQILFVATGVSAGIVTGATSSTLSSFASFKDCTFKFNATGQDWLLKHGTLRINGGGIDATSADVTQLFTLGGAAIDVAITNFDFSQLANSFALLNSAAWTGKFVVENCKMPSGWTETIGRPTSPYALISIVNCDDGDTNYDAKVIQFAGDMFIDTGIYFTGTDGIKLNTALVPFSRKIVTTADVDYILSPFRGLPTTYINESTASQSVTLEIIHNDAANLTERDIYLEVEYPDTAGSTKFVTLTDNNSTIITASPGDQTTSSADWDDGLTARANSTAYSLGNMYKAATNPGRAFICTTAGTSAGSEPAGIATATDGSAAVTDGTAAFQAMRRQKIAVTFTAAEQGRVKFTPVVTKASTTVWISGKATIA